MGIRRHAQYIFYRFRLFTKVRKHVLATLRAARFARMCRKVSECALMHGCSGEPMNAPHQFVQLGRVIQNEILRCTKDEAVA